MDPHTYLLFSGRNKSPQHTFPSDCNSPLSIITRTAISRLRNNAQTCKGDANIGLLPNGQGWVSRRDVTLACGAVLLVSGFQI